MKTNKIYKSTSLTGIFNRLTLAIVATAIGLTVPNTTFAQTDDVKHGYVPANGINYYYEIHGQKASAQAKPLLLLHGGLGSFEMFNSILPMLIENRQVIGVDLHGHGRTELGDRPISYVGMGNDMAAILQKLDYDKVDVLGYSLGGGVALRFAVQHPEVVNKLVIVAGVFARNGFYPGILKQQAKMDAEMADAMKNTPMYQSYKALAPHPEDFPKLLEQMGTMMAKPFNWSEDVKKIEMPVMLIYPDAGMIQLEHIVEFYHLLGGGLRDAGWQRQHMPPNRLAILPNLTHYEMHMAPKMAETALTFLNGEGGPKSWKRQVEEGKN